MKELLSLGLIPGLGPAAGDLFQQGAAGPVPQPDAASAKFWTDFLDYRSVPRLVERAIAGQRPERGHG